MSRQSLVLPQEQISGFCRKWRVSELAIFGSALRADFGSDSDVDVLVSFLPGSAWSLLEHAQMALELENVLGRPVDLVSRRAVERSHNRIRRDAILSSAEPVYVAG